MSIINLLNGLEHLYPENNVISQMKRTLQKFPECESALVDAYSLGQLKSKLWLIENLPENLGNVFIVAGWYGTLASLMFDKCRNKFEKIRNFDIDGSCASVADNLNRPWVTDGWQFKASTMDIHSMKYPTTYTTYRANGTGIDITEMPDTIINTSCEHIENFDEWYENIPKGTLLVLQSNNYFDLPEHVNCSENLDKFNKSIHMPEVFYLGELSLSKYKRFMKIGYK